jgi:hypothetical protein
MLFSAHQSSMGKQVRGNRTGEMQKTGGWPEVYRGHCGDGDDRVWDGLRTQDHWICLYLFVVHIYALLLSCLVFP